MQRSRWRDLNRSILVPSLAEFLHRESDKQVLHMLRHHELNRHHPYDQEQGASKSAEQ